MSIDVVTDAPIEATHDTVLTHASNPALSMRRINTGQLFADVKEVMIDHLGETYVLRLTKQNKLILTK